VRLKYLDLIIAIMIAAMNVAWALIPHSQSVVGIILALPLVLLLPGYTLTEMLFPKRPFGASQRLTLSLGLSLAITILSGFILNLLPQGLGSLSWAGFLGLLTGSFSLVAGYRRRVLTLDSVQPSRLRLTSHDGILFGLASLVLVLAVVYSALATAYQPYKAFTQFWMLPSAQTGKSCVVRLGAHSFETTRVTYRITMTINGAQLATWSPVTLAPQQEWDQVVTLKPVATKNKSYVEARLYRSDQPESVYQRVNLTFPTGNGNSC